MEIKNDGNLDYERLVDEIDEHLVNAFNKLDLDKATGDPLRCYLMLKLLLNKIGDFSPGMQIENVRGQLKNYIGDVKVKDVERLAEKIAANYKEIVNPTYLAASYWSPIDDRRHTALYRREKPADEKEEKRVLAYACAFFSLTTFGARKGYYSATQYTADQAKRKRGVKVSYAEGCDPERWWCIPKNIHQQILGETGITTAIEKYLLKDDVSPEKLKEGLRPLLSNRVTDPVTNLKPFAEYYIGIFPKVASDIIKDPPDYVVQAMEYVNNLFEAELDEEKALFMLLTNVIYDVAFESNYFYAFPVRIPDLCSILTIGTKEPLCSEQYLAIDRVTTSVFMQPLLLDYATETTNKKKGEFQLNVAESMTHEYKNLLGDIPGLGSGLYNQLKDVSKTALRANGKESEVYKKISLLEDDFRRLSTISGLTTAIAFATYSLTNPKILEQMEFIEDPNCKVSKAVACFALDMLKVTKKNWETKECDLNESLSTIESFYGTSEIKELATFKEFALLLFVLNEPIRNMRSRVGTRKEVSIKIDVRGDSLYLCQETFESEPSYDAIQIKSFRKINKLLEDAEGLTEKFIYLDENIVPVECERQSDDFYKINRETKVQILKIPMRKSTAT